MNIIIIGAIVIIIIGVGIWAFGGNKNECPRQIYGYRCKGEACDHSEHLVEKAKRDMGRFE